MESYNQEQPSYYHGIPVITYEEYLALQAMLPSSEPTELSILDIGAHILKNESLKEYVEFEQQLQMNVDGEDNDDEQLCFLEGHWMGYQFMYGTMAYVEFIRRQDSDIASYLNSYQSLSSLFPLDDAAIDAAKAIRTDKAAVDPSSKSQGVISSSDRAAFDFGEILYEGVRLEAIMDDVIGRTISIQALESVDMEREYRVAVSGFYEGCMQAAELMVVSHRTFEFLSPEL